MSVSFLKSRRTAGAGAGESLVLRGPMRADSLLGDRSNAISPRVVRGAARLAELAIIVASGLLIAHLYAHDTGPFEDWRYIASVCLVGLLSTAAFELLGLYKGRAFASFVTSMPTIVLGWTAAFALLIASLFFLKAGSNVSRVWLAAWYGIGLCGIVAFRAVLALKTREWAKAGRLYRRAVIFGSGDVGERVIAALDADGDASLRIVGVFDDRERERAPRLVSGYPRLGGIDDLIALARAARIDIVIVALPLTAEQRLSEVVRVLSVLPVDIKMPAHATAIRFSPHTYSRIGSVAMIDLYEKPLADWGIVSKWLFDKIIGTAAIIALAPIMALVALGVRLESRGTVLFRQKRYGFNNELIEIFKFRSMYVDQCDAAASRLVTRDDPRVTRIGRFIRRTSLDELPQLFNVILGDLSLVGPRPHAVQAKAGSQLYEHVVDGYYARHKMKPGITGWAQINGWRGETDTEEKILRRVEHDLYYIENWSIFLDLYILLKTPAALFKTDKAY